jgi:hypothetical protein
MPRVLFAVLLCWELMVASSVTVAPDVVPRHAGPVPAGCRGAPPSAGITSDELECAIRVCARAKQLCVMAGEDGHRIHGDSVQERVALGSGRARCRQRSVFRPGQTGRRGRGKEHGIERTERLRRRPCVGAAGRQEPGDGIAERSYSQQVGRVDGSGPLHASGLGGQPCAQCLWLIEQVRGRRPGADTGVYQVKRYGLAEERKWKLRIHAFNTNGLLH